MNRATAPAVRPFGHLTMPVENVELLGNGITLHTVYGGDQPISRLGIAFSGGVSESGCEPAVQLALSQMTEGTSMHTGIEIAEGLDYNGARTGFVPHGHHAVSMLYFLNDRATELMPLWGECIVSPTYPEENFEGGRLRALSAFLSSRQEVATIANTAINEMLFGPEHPLGKPLTENAIKALTPDMMRSMHRKYVCPRRIHAFLSGLQDARVEEAVRRMLEAIPALGDGIEPVVLPMQPMEPQRKRIIKDGAFQDAVAAAMPAPDRSNPDYIALRLSVMALGGYFGSRLMTNIREEKGLTYGIHAFLMGSQEGSMVSIAAQCDGANTNTVIDEIAAEMRRLVSEPPRGEELRRLKLHASTDLAEILDTPGSVSGYYANRLFVGTPADYFENQQQAIESLTPEIISEMASRYLNPDALSIVTVGA